MITVRGVDVRAGARLLLSGISFTVSPGDRIGLVGRNGAGKTTLLSTLAGLTRPAAGSVSRAGAVGHLAQDPAAADPAVTVTARILSARGGGRAGAGGRARRPPPRRPARPPPRTGRE
ncbi:ATP-binding cassette domain-containing protein, partial [Streptomyces sp. NPDC127077]|uniref:ATP-binding cassette domain-containing protein n=1 Tax=Streptomyces sp. NPDC127077 TaxID=3347131 RepID=UPI0036683FF6